MAHCSAVSLVLRNLVRSASLKKAIDILTLTNVLQARSMRGIARSGAVVCSLAVLLATVASVQLSELTARSSVAEQQRLSVQPPGSWQVPSCAESITLAFKPAGSRELQSVDKTYTVPAKERVLSLIHISEPTRPY